jgi:hypothetical protein
MGLLELDRFGCLKICVAIVSHSAVFVSLSGNQRFDSEFALSVVTPWKGDYDA